MKGRQNMGSVLFVTGAALQVAGICLGAAPMGIAAGLAIGALFLLWVSLA
jgi:hypothetical protein